MYNRKPDHSIRIDCDTMPGELNGDINRDRDALYLSLVENLPVCVARKNLSGEIIFANQAFCALLGLENDQVYGKTDYDLFPKELADKYRRDDKWVQKTGRTFSDVEQNYSAGEVHYFEVRKTPVVDQDRQIVGTQVIFWDVSAHKRVEAELDQERQLLNALLANTPDNIYFKDKNGRFIRISQANGRRMALNHASDAIGKTDRDFFPEEHALRSRRDEENVMQTGRSIVSKEEELTWPDGTTTWVSTTKAPLRNFIGEIIGTFGISRDITSRKKFEIAQHEAKEAAEAANQAKGNFIAHMSHEIRTPMNAILGLTELALDTELNDQQRDYLSTVLASAESLLGIINQILDFSKIDSDAIELENVPFLLRTVVGDTIKSLEFRAKEKGLQLSWSIAQNVPDGLRGDPTRFRQILVNLIANAIKFTDQGTIRLEIASTQLAPNRIELYVSLIDTGIGIPKEKVDRVFEEFQQADSSTTRNYGGTGLGLAITAKLVQLMNGSVSVDSEVGKGSKFCFQIQLETATTQQLAQISTMSASNARLTDIDSLNILLAEDGLANQKLMVGILEKLGHNVRIANDGWEAVELFNSDCFDLLLMDVQMPVMDGLDACRAIRRLEKGKQIPIIAITAHASESDRQTCLDAGMDDYLRKPIRRHELIEKIQNQIERNSTISFSSKESNRNMNGNVWDINEAMEAVDGDTDLLKEVVKAFLGECDGLLSQLIQAIDDSDFNVLKRAAHTIKGGTRIFGAPAVNDLALQIERHATNEDAIDYKSLADELQNNLNILKSELQRFLEEG